MTIVELAIAKHATHSFFWSHACVLIPGRPFPVQFIIQHQSHIRRDFSIPISFFVRLMLSVISKTLEGIPAI